MRVLVSAATKHGATAEIAARIAATLRADLPDGAVIDVRPVADVSDLTPYDAFVLGSAVYMGRWLDDARDAASRIAAQPPRPVWLFSSGPIGDPAKPHDEPAGIAEIVSSTHAREHRIFAGRLDRHRLGFGERALIAALRVADGDFRDWAAIDAWASRIAAAIVSPGDRQVSFRV